MAERKHHRPTGRTRYPDEFLLAAAAGVFGEQGFHEASMDDVARRAGVTKPTYYARFGVKEEVFDAVLRRTADSLIARFDALYREGPSDSVETGIERMVGAFFAWARARPVEFRLLFAGGKVAPTGIDHRERAIEALTKTLTAGTSRFLRERGLRPGRATGLIVALFVGVLDQSSRWLLEHEDPERLDPVAFVTTFILQGLAGVDPQTLSTLRTRRSADGTQTDT